MQCVRSNISPETVQAGLSGSSLGTGDLEHTTGNAKASVRGNNFDTGNPFSSFTSDLSRDPGAVLESVDIVVQVVNLVACGLGERSGRSQVSEEVAVGGKDVELILRLLLVLGSF